MSAQWKRIISGARQGAENTPPDFSHTLTGTKCMQATRYRSTHRRAFSLLSSPARMERRP